MGPHPAAAMTAGLRVFRIHFAQADSIVPVGVQGLDRYAYVNNSPVRYTDPNGHRYVPEDECENNALPNQPNYDPAQAADL